MYVLSLLSQILASPMLLLLVECATLTLKMYFLVHLILQGVPPQRRPWLYLLGILAGHAITDMSWIIKLVRLIFFSTSEKYWVIFFIRVGWASFVMFYQCLALFLTSILRRDSAARSWQYLMVTVSLPMIIYLLYLAFFRFNQITDRHLTWESTVLTLSYWYVFPTLLLSMFSAIRKIRTQRLPKVITKQVKILINFLIVPYLSLELLMCNPLSFPFTYGSNNYTVVSLSALLLTYVIFYCTRKLLGLRFINLKSHIDSGDNFNFVHDFQNVLEQLRYASTIREVRHIAQQFFDEGFSIPRSEVILSIRTTGDLQSTVDPHETRRDQRSIIIEEYLTHNADLVAHLSQQHVLIRDEVAFDHFHSPSKLYAQFLRFLRDIDADIFLPIYKKNSIVAHLTIRHRARPDQLYTDFERNEMIIFASYLGNIIDLLQHKNFDALICQKKEASETVYYKHREISLYQESVHSFFANAQRQEIGILFYKYGKFSFGNQAAHQLVDIDINRHVGHPLASALREVAHHVETYRTVQTRVVGEATPSRRVICGLPGIDARNVIIVVHYPEVSDLIRKNMPLLNNHDDWNYLLYFETTSIGQLVHAHIPAAGPTLLNFKIDLLKAALNPRPLFLEIPDDDLVPTVELLHHIGLRETLHILELQGQSPGLDDAITLFGANTAIHAHETTPLLEKLHGTGTLFIKNVHHLNLETQAILAKFLRYGFYHAFRSDHKITSDVRIICSSSQDLKSLVREGRFSEELLTELRKNTLTMPSIMRLPLEEIDELSQGLADQVLATKTFKHMMSLTHADKMQIHARLPASIREFRNKIQYILTEKSKKTNMDTEIHFNPAYAIADPTLAEAARLGKAALRDPKIMGMLWKKFKNQNQIADFLKVNRSSVNRRCKQYELS